MKVYVTQLNFGNETSVSLNRHKFHIYGLPMFRKDDFSCSHIELGSYVHDLINLTICLGQVNIKSVGLPLHCGRDMAFYKKEL